ncbi:MAG: fumarylacetoacetate hydrolase family protein [Shimia sp.]|uniref:fumarylacetoacetate hydrolase family protein n=1 Tax=Shimia sp. TaxID=1954381 RepID=UPI004058B8E9
MTTLLFNPLPVFSVPLTGTDSAIPVSRIFCAGRNYAAHAAEMGGEVDREAPWYFTKSVAHAVLSGAKVPFPPGTQNYHHEMELAFAIGTSVSEATETEAQAAIIAYGCGLDMTRRDRQQDGKDHRRPWSLGKDVENSAVFSAMTLATDFGPPSDQRIHLEVDGESRQDASLAEMIWSPVEIVRHLSRFYTLRSGDMIMTGTPAGVGAVSPGQTITGGIEGLDPISLTLETVG